MIDARYRHGASSNYTMSQLKLFSAGSAVSEGFKYQPDIISPGWGRGAFGAAETALRKAGDIPSFLLSLRDKAAGFAGLEPSQLQQVLVTEQDAGAGIGWNRDKAVFEWEHSIPEVDELRYSITFRNFRPVR